MSNNFHYLKEPYNKHDPLVVAIHNGDLETVEHYLRDLHKNPNTKKGPDSLLNIATSSHKTDVVRLLLHYGADPNMDFDNSMFAKNHISLYNAITSKQYEIADLLLKAGADPNIKGYRFGTLLNEAIFTTDRNMVELLLFYGANPRILNEEGSDSYQFALQHAHRVDSDNFLFTLKPVYEDIAQLIQTYENLLAGKYTKSATRK